MFKSDKLTVLIESDDEVFVMKLIGELTTMASFDFNKYLKKIIPTVKTAIVIDLSQCNFISSSGVSSLFYLYRLTKENNLDVTLFSPQPTIYRIFQTVNLDKLLKIEGVAE